jgi:hypothetical protein
MSLIIRVCLDCHGRGREFESRRPRHSFQSLAKNRHLALGSKRVQLDCCCFSFQYLLHNLALRQTLLRHTCVRIQGERDSAVRVSKKFLHHFHIFAILREQRRVCMTKRVKPNAFRYSCYRK